MLYDEIKGIVGEINASELSKRANVRRRHRQHAPATQFRSFLQGSGILKITSEGMNDFKASQAKESRKKTLRPTPRAEVDSVTPPRAWWSGGKEKTNAFISKDEDERTKKSRK